LSADPLGVRAGCEWVAGRARDVELASLDTVLDAIADVPVPEWDSSRHYAAAPERTQRYMVVLDTLNFSFWGGEGGGYWELAERLRDVFTSGDELADAARLENVTADRLGELIGPFPMLAERAEALRELGSHGFEGLIGAGAAETARNLSTKLRSFADIAGYDGRRVPLLKRAQILASDLHGSGAHPFPDIDALTCFADYKLPQMLRHWGAMRYSDRLAARIDAQRPLQPGEPAEVEIRAATVVAVERLREGLDARGRQLNSVQIDWILWDAAQDRRGINPYHRVRTVFY
jgi:hypothetical protein